MALTRIEMEYMQRVPNLLRGIEEQLTRIADALEASNKKQNNKEDEV
jgi:hypothetical protein